MYHILLHKMYHILYPFTEWRSLGPCMCVWVCVCIYPFFDELIETANDNLFDFFFLQLYLWFSTEHWHKFSISYKGCVNFTPHPHPGGIPTKKKTSIHTHTKKKKNPNNQTAGIEETRDGSQRKEQETKLPTNKKTMSQAKGRFLSYELWPGSVIFTLQAVHCIPNLFQS